MTRYDCICPVEFTALNCRMIAWRNEKDSMRKKSILYITVLVVSMLISILTIAQDRELKIALYDGFIVGGYVDDGAYLNFTGPNINFKNHNSKFVLGMLPSLRFKEDRGIPKNAFVTPTLGVGLTYSYKIWAFQIPFYYNPKTATQNGRWHTGVGLGLRLDAMNKGRNK